MTAMKKDLINAWLKDMYGNEIEDHIAIARHEHLCALGSPDIETATIHENMADIHRAYVSFLNMLMNDKTFIINIKDDKVYLNGEIRYFEMDMDKKNREDDLNKKVILALANEMGYESTFLFEEMSDRLSEMLDEIDEV